MIYKIFFRLTKFSLYDHAASFDLNFLESLHRLFKILSLSHCICHVDAKNHSHFWWQFFLSYPVLVGRGDIAVTVVLAECKLAILFLVIQRKFYLGIQGFSKSNIFGWKCSQNFNIISWNTLYSGLILRIFLYT